MKRVIYLWTIFIFKARVCKLVEEKPMEIYYTNITETRCFEFKNVTITEIANVQNVMTNKIMFNIINNRTVFTGPYENRTKVPVLTNNTLTFCILKMDFTDAGYYELHSSGGQAEIKSFVLGKPTAAQIAIIDNGTLDYSHGRLSCSSRSISKPSGLTMTYSWKVNKKEIIENAKYSFAEPFRSELIVKVNRTELFNMYNCMATEDHGQTSASSKVIKLSPKRSPIVMMKPKQGLHTILRGERLTIECDVKDANPEVNSITWYKNNKKIQNELGKTYTIVNASVDDTANYSCSAANGIGETGFANMTLKVLNMTVPPVSKTEISSTTVEVLVLVSLLCSFLLVTCSIAVALFRHSKSKRRPNENAQQVSHLMPLVDRQNSEQGDTNQPGMPPRPDNAREYRNENERNRLENESTSNDEAESPENTSYAQVVKPKVKRPYENLSGMPSNVSDVVEQRNEPVPVHSEINSPYQLENRSPPNDVYTQVVKVNVESDRVQIDEVGDGGKCAADEQHDNPFDKSEKGRDEELPKARKAKGELVYSELDLAPSGNKRFVIKETGHNTNYADIDLTKHADPLPDDSPETSAADDDCCIAGNE